VAQDALGLQAVDGHIVDVGGAGGDQEGLEYSIKAAGVGALLFHPAGLAVLEIGKCSHRGAPRIIRFADNLEWVCLVHFRRTGLEIPVIQ
jgi:hypothetical protein